MIRFTGFVENADIPNLWAEAGFYVFPSLFEGFGLSLIEAMSKGIPCACSNNGSLGEIAGDAAITFDPESVDDMAAALARLLGESEVTQPSGETVEVSAQIIEKRDAIFEDATSRRKLEQMYFDFMKKNGERGTGNGERGTGNGERNMLPKISKQEAARAIWARLMSELDKRTVKDAIALLPPKDAEVCHGRLFELTKLLKEQMSVSR